MTRPVKREWYIQRAKHRALLMVVVRKALHKGLQFHKERDSK